MGVAVEDLDAAIALYEKSFEMELVHRETVDSQGVEAVLLDGRTLTAQERTDYSRNCPRYGAVRGGSAKYAAAARGMVA